MGLFAAKIYVTGLNDQLGLRRSGVSSTATVPETVSVDMPPGGSGSGDSEKLSEDPSW